MMPDTEASKWPVHIDPTPRFVEEEPGKVAAVLRGGYFGGGFQVGRDLGGELRS